MANATVIVKLSYAIMLMANPLTEHKDEMINSHNELQKLINKIARTVLGKARKDMILREELLKRTLEA